MEEDWGLQAIVRGSTDYFDDPAINYYEDGFHFNFPNLFEASNIDSSNDHKVLVNELDELYKPFYPMFSSFSPHAPIITSSSSSSDSFPEEAKFKPEEMEALQKPNKSAKAASPKTTTVHAAKYKRKNQHKRVVVQVTADGLSSSDLWAWRKYGQKPIKGSPYPRSYYRCSSLKGCLARKQVEQSCTDPGMFIVTYSGEHSHSKPTRRSSLAGTNRHKFVAPKSLSSVDTCTMAATLPKDSSWSPTSDISEEVAILQQPVKHEQMAGGNSKDDEFVMPDMILNDDFFVGLEDLDALISTSTFYNCSGEHFR